MTPVSGRLDVRARLEPRASRTTCWPVASSTPPSGQGGGGAPGGDAKTPIARVRVERGYLSRRGGPQRGRREFGSGLRSTAGLPTRRVPWPSHWRGRGSRGTTSSRPQKLAARPRPPIASCDVLEDALALRVADDLVNGFAARQRLHEGPPAAVHAASEVPRVTRATCARRRSGWWRSGNSGTKCRKPLEVAGRFAEENIRDAARWAP